MSKILIACYSWTGVTARVAGALAEALGAEVETIHEARPRRGPLAFVRSIWEVGRRIPAPILAPARRAADYDLVVLATPVWAGRMASPMRAYVEREKAGLKAVAFLATLGGANGEGALAGLRAACGREPRAELLLSAAELKSGAWRAQLEAFARSLTGAAAPAVPPGLVPRAAAAE